MSKHIKNVITWASSAQNRYPEKKRIEKRQKRKGTLVEEHVRISKFEKSGNIVLMTVTGMSGALIPSAEI